MQMNRILCLFVSLVSIFGNDSESCVVAGFQKNNKCYLNCNDNEYSFESINNFSQELNNNNNNYFSVSSVRTENNNNTIILDNFKNNSNTYYCLQLFGDNDYKPDIILNYGYNELKLPKY